MTIAAVALIFTVVAMHLPRLSHSWYDAWFRLSPFFNNLISSGAVVWQQYLSRTSTLVSFLYIIELICEKKSCFNLFSVSKGNHRRFTKEKHLKHRILYLTEEKCVPQYWLYWSVYHRYLDNFTNKISNFLLIIPLC